eukprot:9471850-Pyramimonas_sp.AAC.1
MVTVARLGFRALLSTHFLREGPAFERGAFSVTMHPPALAAPSAALRSPDLSHLECVARALLT